MVAQDHSYSNWLFVEEFPVSTFHARAREPYNFNSNGLLAKAKIIGTKIPQFFLVLP